MKPMDDTVLTIALRRSGAVDKHISGPADWEAAPKALLEREVAALGLSPVELRVFAPRRQDHTAAEQDEEALVEDIARVAYESPGPDRKRLRWEDCEPGVKAWRLPEARAVIAHLRDKGLLRAPEDVDLSRNLRAARMSLRAMDEVNKELILKHDADKAAWQAWSAKAQATLDQANAEIASLRTKLEEAEQALKSCAKWSGGRYVTQEEWEHAMRQANEVHTLQADASRIRATVSEEWRKVVHRLEDELAAARRQPHAQPPEVER